MAGDLISITRLLVLFVPVMLAQETGRTLDYAILEELPSGTYIGNVFDDAEVQGRYDLPDLNSVRFQLLSQPNVGITIGETSSRLTTTERIDRDEVCHDKHPCLFTLDVVILRAEPLDFLEIIKVRVEILDINDNIPVFMETHSSKQIPESVLPGYSVSLPTAMDADAEVNGIQEYELQGGDSKFELRVQKKIDGSTELKLVLTNRLDHESVAHYDLNVLARDGGDPPQIGSLTVSINVLDANDNEPTFDNQTYEINVLENTPLGTTISRIKASDPDAGSFGKITYGLSDSSRANYGHVFGINNATGDLFLKSELDYETGNVYQLAVTAQDHGPDSSPTDTTVIIRVLDVNDNAPTITVNTLAQQGTDSAEVAENSEIGTFVAHLTVKDPDSGRNGLFSCSLNDNQFSLVQLPDYDSEYKIATDAVLDREEHANYNLAVMCTDNGFESQMAIKHVTVTVTDVNDNAPVFSQDNYHASIIENSEPGATLVQLNATDVDSGHNGDVRYVLDDQFHSYFILDQMTGVLRTKASFDHEEASQLRFTVTAMDQGNPPKFTTALMVLDVVDVNDEAPRFSKDVYSFGIYENELPGTDIGAVHAVDPDSEQFNQFEFSFLPIYSDRSKFEIDSRTGKIKTLESLDREKQSKYHLTVLAFDLDRPSLSSTASISIHVSDRNDNSPWFKFPIPDNNTVHISTSHSPGEIVTRIYARDSDIGQNANLTYQIIRGNEEGYFALDTLNGVVFVNSDLSNVLPDEQDSQLFELGIGARDQGIPSLNAATTLNIVVNKSTPVSMALGNNFIIVITMACISVPFVIILIIIINIMRKQDRRRRHRKCMQISGKELNNAVTFTPTSPVSNEARIRVDIAQDSPNLSLPSEVKTSDEVQCNYLQRAPLPSVSHKLAKTPQDAQDSTREGLIQRNNSVDNIDTNQHRVHNDITQQHVQVDNMQFYDNHRLYAGNYAMPPPPPPPKTSPYHNLQLQQQLYTVNQRNGHLLPNGNGPGSNPPRQQAPGLAKLHTFTGTTSNTSADSGFKEGSDRDVSDVDSEQNGGLGVMHTFKTLQTCSNQNKPKHLDTNNAHNQPEIGYFGTTPRPPAPPARSSILSNHRTNTVHDASSAPVPHVHKAVTFHPNNIMEHDV